MLRENFAGGTRRWISAGHWVLAFVIGLLLWDSTRAGARELSQQEIDTLYAQAIKARDVDSIRTAVERLRKAVPESPAPGVVLTRMGMLYLRLEDGENARSALQRALDRDATLAEAQCGLGRVYLELMDNPKRAQRHHAALLAVPSWEARESLSPLSGALRNADDEHRLPVKVGHAGVEGADDLPPVLARGHVLWLHELATRTAPDHAINLRKPGPFPRRARPWPGHRSRSVRL